MKKALKTLYALMYITIIMTSTIKTDNNTDFFNYQCAFVRDLSDSFENSLKLHPPIHPIDMNLAKKQHDNYIHTLKTLIPHVFTLQDDSAYPDCNFIEDTAIIIDNIVVISNMGALERRVEEIAVADAFQKTGKNIVPIQAPGTMDGGDILYTGKHLFVGLSHRTNTHALEQLKEIFNGSSIEVIGIPVQEGLHLKSLISFFDSETMIIADTQTGRSIQDYMQSSTKNAYDFVFVPDAIAANVLRIKDTLIIQDGFKDSEHILQTLCKQKGVKLITLSMSELIKADGALTCGSLLFS